MRNLTKLLMMSVVAVWSMNVLAMGTVTTTMIKYTLDDGRVIELPAQHILENVKDEDVKSVTESIGEHGSVTLGKTLGTESALGKYYNLGLYTLKAMNEAVLAARDKGQEAMVAAANNILSPKVDENTATLWYDSPLAKIAEPFLHMAGYLRKITLIDGRVIYEENDR